MLAFFQGDQIIAQRHFSGEQLGRYTGAGLLGRTIVWASAPILTVYFTRRSSHDSALGPPTALLCIYLGMLGAGAIGILWLRDPFLQMFLGLRDADLSGMTAHFAWAMLPIGILQAIGYHFLATRRLPECIAFAVCAAIYLATLSIFGRSPDSMLRIMMESAAGFVIVLTLVSAVSRQRSPAPQMP